MHRQSMWGINETQCFEFSNYRRGRLFRGENVYRGYRLAVSFSGAPCCCHFPSLEIG